MRYCGRDFSEGELAWIRRLIAEEPERTRVDISQEVCRAFGWHKPDGGLKEMSCRVALLRMHREGLITLPPPRRKNGNGKAHTRRTPEAEPRLPLVLFSGALAELRVELVSTHKQSALWNEYIARYHYLGYKPLPGAQLRYMVRFQNEELALFGFGASAWKTAPRDRFIGWSAEQRKAGLHLVVNNARFLILPWVQWRNLASKALSLVSKRLALDWQERYGDALKDKKPFELPFQQGRDTGDRTMPFGGDPLHPELRVLPTDHLKHTQSLPTRIHNIPTQAQANPNGQWMQGTQPWPEMREPMFDYSDTFRTPAPGPSDAYQPPLLQAPIRVPVTNRADTEYEWRGPIGNSSASARALDQNFTHAPPRVAPQENPWPGAPGDPGCGAPGHVATGITARMTQREGNEWYNQPGPVSGPGQTPMQYTDTTRPTIRQTTEQSVVLPRIVRSDNGVGPMSYNPARPTGRQTTEEAIVPPGLQAGSGQTPMQFTDQTRPTIKQSLESSVVMGPMQNTGPSAPTEHYSDQFRPTLREGVESLVVQPPQQLPQGGAVTMPYVDRARTTQREDTEQLTQVGRISGAASGKGAVRHYDDEFRDTRRQFTAENPQLGPALNSSAAAGGYTSTGIQVPQTERNRDMEDTYSFGPVSAETKSPMDRSYLTNITFDDRKEIGLYNRIPARDRFTDVPRNLYGNYNLPPDDQLDFTRTGNPDYSQENQRRLIPSSHYNPNKDLLQVNECRNIEPYQIQQLATNPYSTDVRVIAGQSNY